MISDGTFIEFECALSNDKHFIKEPITLSACGHSVCRMCLPKKNDNLIKCKICGETTKRDLSNDKESISIKIAFKRNLDNLLKVLEIQSNVLLDKLKKQLSSGIEKIDSKIQLLKDEIDIRIESIKDELDKFNEKFQSELDLIKSEIIKVEYGELEKNNSDIKNFESNLKELKNAIENKLTENEDKFYEYQDHLRKINKLMQDCESFQLEFKTPVETLNRSIIGEIVYTNFKQIDDKDVRQKFKQANIEIYGVNVKPYYLCVLPNGQLASVNRNDKNITIYDWKFYLVKLIDKIDNKPFSPYEMIVNNNDNCIYILDRSSHQIIMTDLDFNKLKVFGSQGCNNDKFNVPYSMSYKNNYLYVCDRMNKRIQILTSSLEFVKSVLLDYKPRYICVTEKVACVKNYEETETYFYDLDRFTLKYQFKHNLGRITVLNSNFYEICVVTKKVYCFNNDGSLCEDISLSKFSNYVTNSWNGHIVCFNGSLIMSCSSQKLLIKF